MNQRLRRSHFLFHGLASVFVLTLVGSEARLAAAQAAVPERAVFENYVLGPEDQLAIRVMDSEEIADRPMRVDANGFLRLPLAGRVRVEGLTLQQLEATLAERLKPYIKDPQVTVSVTEARSNPISVMGAVKTPGVHQIQGPRTLVEALSQAGGLAEDAGYTIKITRRIQPYGAVPIEGAVPDSSGQYSVAEIRVRELLEARNPKVNIQVRPHDVITIPRAQLIYVVGEVNKPGGFTLRESETLSVLQAISLAQGLSRVARPKAAKILRQDETANARSEIPVNVGDILAGKSKDFSMRADDVLFIPNNAPKSAALRGLEAAIQMGTGVVIWRR
ncbi:MAG: polysaccharide biosynthesis/export family protein [Bryobacterales bacterium]|nr:polysaccharide biosynthesis/export family protein [Bryobacterales bacterium]